MLGFGWRAAFGLMGAAGLVVAVAWIALYRDRRALPKERATTEGAPGLWRKLVAAPTLWAMVLGNFGSGYMNWFYAAWLPGYLETARHVSISKTGWLAAIPYVFGVIGSLTGGWLCDRLARGGLSAIASRKVPIVAGMLAGCGLHGPGHLRR